MQMYTANKDSSNALNNFDLLATEAPIYGSSRVGVWNKSDLAEDNQNDLSVFNRLLYNNRGRKFYEISNHLGNVLTTISDKKMPHNNGSGIADYYTTDVVSATDYYPFGMQSIQVLLHLTTAMGLMVKKNQMKLKEKQQIILLNFGSMIRGWVEGGILTQYPRLA